MYTNDDPSSKIEQIRNYPSAREREKSFAPEWDLLGALSSFSGRSSVLYIEREEKELFAVY